MLPLPKMLLVASALFLIAFPTVASPAFPFPPSGPLPPAKNQQLARAIFRDLVAVHSVHDVGTQQAADVVVHYLKANGISASDIHELADPKYPRQMNVVVRLHGAGHGKPIMWLGHLDVVEAKPEDWSLPPFQLTERDGYFYGRGATDMKEDDAAMLASFLRLKHEGFVPEQDIILAFTADEEVGEEEDGAAWLAKEKRSLVNAGLLIDTDGSSGEIENGRRLDFNVETSEKTYVTYTLDITNKGGHSSEPRPDNPIYSLANALTRLSHYQFPITLLPTTREYFRQMAAFQTGERRSDMLAVAGPKVDMAATKRLTDVPPFNAILHSTCVATMLKAGVQENALPAHAQATVQCRIMPGETVNGTRDTLVRIIDDPEIKVSVLGMVTSAPESPPSPALFSAITNVVHSMWPGVPVIPSMSAGASDSIFMRNAGIPSYGLSGVWGDIHDPRAHGRDERIESGDFYASVEFTYRLMKALATGQ
jgi:acetylornithine deacetylase/succinyl-diaminopimelate desuccinylase-like protein